MASWLILAVAVIYLAISVDLIWSDQAGLALAFAGYAASNVGLFLVAAK